MNRLIKAKYDIAFFDTVDIGALYLFQLGGIKNVFGINYTQNLQYEYIFDKHSNNNRGWLFQGFFGKIFGKQTDVKFKNIPTMPEVKVEDLYLKINGIFINNDKLLSNLPIDDKKYSNLHYVGGFHLNGVKELQNTKSHGKPNKVIISLDYCEEILTLFDDIVDTFIYVIKEVTNKFKGDNKVEFIYNCHIKDNELANMYNIQFALIPRIQDELMKGETSIIITNCGFSRMIEAFAFNIQVICLPAITDVDIAKAKALKGKKRKHVINTATDYDSNKEVSESFKRAKLLRRKRGVDAQDSFNIKYDKIVANIEIIDGKLKKDTLMKVLMDMLTTEKYKNNVSKAFHYLHDKWQHTLPQDVLLEEVKKVLDK
uniref:Uncharacterized protein n=1 Tax=Meloidogyne enterolobii TaxID=390850 RepID=A0A6V7UVH6_MELEN|nr:unnamed protein product [Meloidogyne enterolobii]